MEFDFQPGKTYIIGLSNGFVHSLVFFTEDKKNGSYTFWNHDKTKYVTVALRYLASVEESISNYE